MYCATPIINAMNAARIVSGRFKIRQSVSKTNAVYAGANPRSDKCVPSDKPNASAKKIK